MGIEKELLEWYGNDYQSNRDCCPEEGRQHLRQTHVYAYSIFTNSQVNKEIFWLRAGPWIN